VLQDILLKGSSLITVIYYLNSILIYAKPYTNSLSYIIHLIGGIIPLLANMYATVPSLPFTPILISCYHSFGGTIPFSAKFMATVRPKLSVIVVLCHHIEDGIIPLSAK